jgi:predicted kinase
VSARAQGPCPGATAVEAVEAVLVGGICVLVGASGSGKTTFRRAVVEAGMPPDRVVSLDDLRRQLRAESVARGQAARPLQQYSAAAVRRAERRQDALAALGNGYLADATHLRRRDRRVHARIAGETGLATVAVLFPLPPLEELLARNATRPPEEQVPPDVLARQHHRRSLLTVPLLLEEGFTAVLEV